MHLSHLFEDLAAWYQTFDFQARVDTTFRPGPQVPPDADGAAGAGRRPDRGGGRARLRPHRRIGHSRLDPAGVAARRATSSGRRDSLPEGNRGPAAGGLQHARQPVRLDAPTRARRFCRRARRGAPLRRLQPDERRLPAHAAGDGRRAARRDDAHVRGGDRSVGASIRCSRPRTARTSSSRRGRTAPSRSPSSMPKMAWARASAEGASKVRPKCIAEQQRVNCNPPVSYFGRNSSWKLAWRSPSGTVVLVRGGSWTAPARVCSRTEEGRASARSSRHRADPTLSLCRRRSRDQARHRRAERTGPSRRPAPMAGRWSPRLRTRPKWRRSSTSRPSHRTRASPFNALIADPPPGAPVPDSPPQEGFLFLDGKGSRFISRVT